MDIKKIKVGQSRAYESKANIGRGTVKEIYERKTGSWVKLHDKRRGVDVTVRPSQVSA